MPEGGKTYHKGTEGTKERRPEKMSLLRLFFFVTSVPLWWVRSGRIRHDRYP
jgi:hypothetical protein